MSRGPFLPVRESAPYIALSGPIGVGKSVLAEVLHRYLVDTHGTGERPAPLFVPETFADNPFLPRLYEPGGIERWGLACEMAFLPARYDAAQQIAAYRSSGHPVVTDFTVHQCLVYSRLTLNDLEFETYRELFHRLMATAPLPDLLVVLDASFEAIQARIAGRGRAMEQSIDVGYLRRLHESYRAWHSAPPPAARVLVLDTTELLIPSDPAAQATAVREVLNALAMPLPEPAAPRRHRAIAPTLGL